MDASKHHLKTKAFRQHLTFLFHPPPAVDVYERIRGSDGVKVAVGQVADDAEMEGEG